MDLKWGQRVEGIVVNIFWTEKYSFLRSEDDLLFFRRPVPCPDALRWAPLTFAIRACKKATAARHQNFTYPWREHAFSRCSKPEGLLGNAPEFFHDCRDSTTRQG